MTLRVMAPPIPPAVPIAAHWWVAIAILDYDTGEYLAGVVILNGTPHSVEAGGYYEELVLEGSHTVDIVVPSGYRFVQWYVWDWNAGRIIDEPTERPLTYMINKSTFFYGVVQRVPAGKPYAHVVISSFPTEAKVNEAKPWSMTVHNSGDASGEIGVLIENLSGNPGDIEIYWKQINWTITVSPGEKFIASAIKDVCENLTASGTVKFKAPGTYTVRTGGVHKENTTWITDSYLDSDVSVTPAPIPTWILALIFLGIAALVFSEAVK